MIPCEWEVIVPDELCPSWAAKSDTIKNSALWMASTVLWGLTGRQYGTCPVTVRPAQDQFFDPAYRDYVVRPGQQPGSAGPYLFAGVWRNCGCGSSCCCQAECAVVLDGPVAAINEVLVSGLVVPSSSYRVDIKQGAYLLVRLDGTCWPTCQSFQAAEDAAGAFAVTYERGRAVPEALAIATAIMACEYATFLSTGECGLPPKMTTMTRQGVQIEVEPPAPADGLTGITQVDAVVAALNPGRRQRPPVVLSLDLPEQNCDRITLIQPGVS
jgi:hypothetical protein